MNESRFLWFFLYLIDLRNLEEEQKVSYIMTIVITSVTKPYFQLRNLADPRSKVRREHVAAQPQIKLSSALPSEAVPAKSCIAAGDHPTAEVFTVKDDQSFQCNLCGKIYLQKGSMKTHLEKNHQIANVISFVCTKCGKNFDSQKKLTRHTKTKCLIYSLSKSFNKCESIASPNTFAHILYLM